MEQIVNYFDTVGVAKKAYARLMEPVCRNWSLTRNELDVLLFLYNNPGCDRSVDIVEHRGMAKSHVSLSVSNLESRELLLRRFEPSDRRTAHLELTESGKTIAREGQEAQRAFFGEIYQGLTPEDMTLWQAITQRICENIRNLGE